MFFPPIWHSESERIGKQKCTRIGYALHNFADMLGLCGLITFMISLVRLVPGLFFDSPEERRLWLYCLLFAIVLGIMADVLRRFSWRLATRKGFQYDHARSEASWIENGERVTWHWEPPTSPPTTSENDPPVSPES